MNRKMIKAFPIFLYTVIIVTVVWYGTVGKEMLVKKDYKTLQNELISGKDMTDNVEVGKKINLSSANSKTIKEVVVVSGNVTVDKNFNITPNDTNEAVVIIKYTDSTKETLTINGNGQSGMNKSYEIVGVTSDDNSDEAKSCIGITNELKGCLIKDSTEMDVMVHNSKVLQNMVNYGSSEGTATNPYTIYLPSGTYYFYQTGTMIKQTEKGVEKNHDYVIFQKSNVAIIGKGNDDTKTEYTKLKPFGKGTSTFLAHGLNMFYYTDERYYNGDLSGNYKYLENVTYKNFIIDSNETKGYKYNANGKGFFLTFCKNSTWDTVTVKNTDGTGFGMDMLINAKIVNCIASGCGKNATTTDAGASGFGIGTGTTDDESVLIENCKSTNNTKFGYFFENQTRFARGLANKAVKSDGYIVKNSTASGNLHNYGGLRANDVVLINNTSTKPKGYDVFFSDQSRNTFVVGTKVNNKFTDVKNTHYAYNAVQWAIQNGISIGKNEADLINRLTNYEKYTGSNASSYGLTTKITRAESVLMIWRMMGRPGNVVTSTNNTLNVKKHDYTTIKTGFSDVNESAIYAQAVQWAKEKGVTTGTSKTEFSPTKTLTKLQFITMMYRLAGKPNGVGAKETTTAENWAKEKGIIVKNSDCSNAITRAEAVTILYRYYNTISKEIIDAYPNYLILQSQ